MIIVYHIPNDTPHIETWSEEPSRSWMEYKCREVGACAYTPMEDDHVDPPARVADGERGIRGGGVVA